MDLTLAVFAAVYLAMLLGGVPGLQLDRTGAALLGAVTLIAGGAVAPAAAWSAIDAPTIGLLLGMMLLSAQFRLGGGYTRLCRWIATRPVPPQRLLLLLMLATGTLSALLTNDVVCLAFAPVLIDACRQRRLDPVPFLLGLAAASNIGSAATLIGNPQNILIGQELALPFAGYLLDGVPVAAAGLFAAWWILQRAYRSRFERELHLEHVPDRPFDAWQTGKGTALLLLLLVAFCASPLPRDVLALLAGGVVLLSRRFATRDVLAIVDWPLLVLFAGLFVVNDALAAHGHAASLFGWLAHRGLDLAEPAPLFATAVVGSNVISNVPLTMLVLPHAGHPQAGPILALATTLAGNLLLVGSIANLIVVASAEHLDVRPRARSWFAEHVRTGVPITLATLACAGLWLWLRAALHD